MRTVLYQFYNEGFAVLFYRKPVEFLSKKIKSKRALKFLSAVIKVLYTCLMLALVIKLVGDRYLFK